jgi:hypothetical protein
MALQSPGVEVTVIDESFYTPAEPGTTPLIVIATAENKTNAANTGTAAGTLAANVGKAFRVTSQRELIDLYGIPFFEKTASGSPIHGGERNEYGLLAAYSLLGVTNSVFVTRANIDLSALDGESFPPGADPADKAWWFDTRSTAWGIQEWNSSPALVTGGQKFATKIPLVLTSNDITKISGGAPAASVGSIGDYAIVALTDNETVTLHFKSAGNGHDIDPGQWVAVGSADWYLSNPTVVSSTAVTTITSSAFLINDITINTGDNLSELVTNINAASTATSVFATNKNGILYLYAGGTPIVITGPSALLDSQLFISAGTYNGLSLTQAPHTQVPQWKVGGNLPRPTGSVWIKTTEPNFGSRWRIKQWRSAAKTWEEVSSPLYTSGYSALYFLDRAGGGLNIPINSVYVQYDSESTGTATFKIWHRAAVQETVIKTSVIDDSTFTAGTNTFTLTESIRGSALLGPATVIEFTTGENALANANAMAAAINAAGFKHIEADVTTSVEVIIYHKTGGDFELTDGTGSPLSAVGFSNATINLYSSPADADYEFVASNWMPLYLKNFAALPTQPLQEPADGQLWYNPNFGEVDIMIHDGTTWKGYGNVLGNSDPQGPTVSASKPETQSDGNPHVDGDLWISTADLENFPTIYKWNISTKEWDLIDKSDQTTEDGILFADARYGTSGETGNTVESISKLLKSDYLDPDAPDPDLYPRGMMLWNLRRSGGNVKRYSNNYINVNEDNPRLGNEGMEDYATDRWVTASPNNEDGSGTFGRKAQRSVIVQTLKSVVDTSEEIRDEERRNFNLISCPGYPELLSNLINLNIDRGLTAFVVGDSPMRLRSDATSLTAWGTNANGVFDNGDAGLVSSDEYSAVWYPNGFTTDLGGANVVVPSSHMMLKTIALSDQVSYPWFAPAGTRRGGITNATSVGFIDAISGEFQTVALNNGQRDTLYDLRLNPIPFFVGVGHVAYGQKTLARNASALDRINVARLVVYLRSQLNRLARPYIFEPNDKITRDEIRGAVESLLLELVGLRALYDFAVVCDDSNNTPARVDRNELWVDVAIEPVKAVEFIYIPLRIQNTGEI